MDCLVLPVSILSRRCSGHLLGYRQLTDDFFVGSDDPITVVVGKEKKEFLVDPFVLDESPFRVLIDLVKNKKKHSSSSSRLMVDQEKKKRVLYVDVDAILFEHMLWLMHNDASSLFKLNLREIIDFYAQDY
ncbi:hypothetical protein L2E82_48023 [Cichorium intybus]|uniref:Uncharacterized protein n=1 Tax=Cichorium intybus TaxID=13427 RepID=A0ACB8YY66_CICIN|nr:hypothetical protein L1887_27500 [Cichorium endivia]KAI3690048.1 hypothetical protein L2E82_48023 [Cichorium intybus]